MTMLTRDAAGAARVEYRAAALGRRCATSSTTTTAEAPVRSRGALVEGDMLRALDGRYAFAADRDGTLVDYTLRVDLAIPCRAWSPGGRASAHGSSGPR